MEKEHLHLLIHEEIFLLPEDEVIDYEVVAEQTATAEETKEVQGSSKVAEPEPESIIVKEEKVTEDKKPEEEQNEEPHQESPHIPHHDLPDSKPLPFAVFHTSHEPLENELLHKIIDACKIPETDYKVFSNGFDQSVKFRKALVFVPEAKAFYTPIPYKGSEFLCSKPLADLAKDQNEKAKLWGALQKFIVEE